ncbi:speckle-type POZ protein B-like [Planococcus citri]|uniref:speckle-type POZ protein B-like n=1 Tax=Planococcus citri TaxID=170843 RepID=UPI0031F9352A
MNPFYLTWMVFFTLYCSSQSDPLGPVLNGTDSEHRIRCDTYSPVHEINYIWTIRQFSHHEALNTSEILSPKLYALTTDKYEWYIQFRPNCIDGGNEVISVYVRLFSGSIIREALVYLSISIINHKEETLLKRSSPQTRLVSAGEGRGWRPYCKKDEFFRHHLLQNNTLTLLINIRWLESQLCNNVSHERNPSATPIQETTNFLQSEPSKNADSEYMIRCDTFMQFHEIKYLWTIRQFSHHETLNTSEILSPKLRAPTTNEYEWDIKIDPNHIHERNKTIAVYVFLSGGSTVRETAENFCVSIINHKKETLFYKNQTIIKHQAGTGHGWYGYCNKDDFFRNHLLQNDTLMLLINIKWLSQHCNNVSHEREIPPPTPSHETTTILLNSSDHFKSPQENPKFANVLTTNDSDFQSTLETLKHSDVVFTTNGSNYPAHKAILAARSPIFAAMFQRKDAKGGKNKTIRINVKQMNEEVLRAMLRYIYTGKCENLGKLADKLFVAAAKYGLDGLRQICEQKLCETLSAEKAEDMFVFAKKHHANELKSKAVEFLTSRSIQKSNTTN